MDHVGSGTMAASDASSSIAGAAASRGIPKMPGAKHAKKEFVAVKKNQKKHRFSPERCSCPEALQRGAGRQPRGKPHRRCEEQAPQGAAQRPQRRLWQYDGHAIRCVYAQDTGIRPWSPCAQSIPQRGHPEPQAGQMVHCSVDQHLAEVGKRRTSLEKIYQRCVVRQHLRCQAQQGAAILQDS